MAYVFGCYSFPPRPLTLPSPRKRSARERRDEDRRPHPVETGWGRPSLGRLLFEPAMSRSGGDARGLLHDREAHAGLVAVLFRDFAPAIFGLLTGLERTFDLSGAFHELVEVHRAELAANHPEIAAFGHPVLLLFGCLNRDFRAVRLELRGFGRVVKRRRRRGAAGDRGRDQVEIAGADFALVARRRIAELFRRELGLLQAGIRRHTLGLVAARQLKHAVVERVEARQRHELELIPHRADLALEFRDR